MLIYTDSETLKNYNDTLTVSFTNKLYYAQSSQLNSSARKNMKPATNFLRVGLICFGLSTPFNLILFLSMRDAFQQAANHFSTEPTSIATHLEAYLSYAYIGIPLLLAGVTCLIIGCIMTRATSGRGAYLQSQS